MTPDLFSTVSPRDHSSLSPDTKPATVKPSAPATHHVLPNDLPAAIRYFDDDELPQLQAAVATEQQRRGKILPAEESKSTEPAPAAAVSLKPGKMNAVRAAFQAGITPAKIAKQFGVPQAEVRKAIAGIGENLNRDDTGLA